MTRIPPSDGPVDASLSAEEWLARLLAPDSGVHDSEAFARWRRADPEHAAMYAEAENLHRNAALLAGDPLLRAAARAARRDTAVQRTRHRRRRWLLAAGIAASLLLAIGLGLLRQHDGGDAATEQHYVNAIGLPQTLRLADGTQLRLDAESAITVRLDPAQRTATLEHGRVEFTVAHDPQRPFLVRAANNTIRDIGTVFQVQRDEDGVTVGLLKGKVEVSGSDGRWIRALKPAQQLHIDGSGAVGAVAPLDLVTAQGWTHGELAFRDRRLGDLLNEMNRYSKTRLSLGDPSLAGLEVSGSFHAGDQDALAKALARGWQLRVVRTAANELTLLPAIERQR